MEESLWYYSQALMSRHFKSSKLYLVVLPYLYLDSLSIFSNLCFLLNLFTKNYLFTFWNSCVLLCGMFLFTLIWQIWMYYMYGAEVIIEGMIIVGFVEIPTDRKLSMHVVILSSRVKNWKVYLFNYMSC